MTKIVRELSLHSTAHRNHSLLGPTLIFELYKGNAILMHPTIYIPVGRPIPCLGHYTLLLLHYTLPLHLRVCGSMI